MKLNIIRLGSVVPGGVGGPEAGAIDLIYSFLLQEHNSEVYSHIHINQIGDDLQEVIIKEGRKISINIRYAVNGFKKKDTSQQNLIRLDVVHTALLRIAEKEKKLDKNVLNQIRDRIIENNFEFDFIYKKYDSIKHQLDRRKEIELHVLIRENKAELVNLTKYKTPPFYEMMKAGATNEEAYKNWLHSLPPGAAGTITFEPN